MRTCQPIDLDLLARATALIMRRTGPSAADLTVSDDIAFVAG